MLNNPNKDDLIAIAYEIMILVVGLCFLFCSDNSFLINVSASLIATGITLLLNTILVSWRSSKKAELDKWGLTKIYKTRQTKGNETDPLIRKIKYKFDIVAFGLRSLRDRNSKDLEDVLKRGINIRIITMDPESDLIAQREMEEGAGNGHIKKSIEDLIKWAKKLNDEDLGGKILIKGYKCMTLDFYYRMDREIYVGPYWFGIESQQTITFRFEEGKEGFSTYENYFEKLWNSTENFRNLLVD